LNLRRKDEKTDGLNEFNRLVLNARNSGAMSPQENDQIQLATALMQEMKISGPTVEMKTTMKTTEMKLVKATKTTFQGQHGVLGQRRRSQYAQDALAKSKILKGIQGDQASGININDCSD
jgi:hypothetical protein